MTLQTPTSLNRRPARKRRRFHALVALGLLLALTLALAACGGDTTTPQAAAPTGTPAPASTPAVDPAGAPPPATTTPAATTPPATTAQPSSTTTQSRRTGRRHRRTRTATTTTPQAQPDPAPTPAPEPQPPAKPAGTPIEEVADLVLVNRAGPTHYFQQGTVVGTYNGTMELEAKVVPKGVRVHFTATVEGGTIEGKGLAIPIIDGSNPTARINGTARILGGTGRFASAHGRRLAVTGTVRLDASRAHVRLAGTVFFS